MNICNKCKKYIKCYSDGTSYVDELNRKADIDLVGCPNYKELTIEEMFGLKPGVLNDRR